MDYKICTDERKVRDLTINDIQQGHFFKINGNSTMYLKTNKGIVDIYYSRYYDVYDATIKVVPYKQTECLKLILDEKSLYE